MTCELVSVSIPIYNHATFLTECLDSIASQDYPRIEVVAIDDGSTDGSYEVAQAWQEAHSTAFERFVLRRQENAGLSTTLNRLVDLGKGPYFLPLASDDYLLPDAVWPRVRALKEHPEWLAVIADCTVVDENDRCLYESGLGGYQQADKAALANPATIAVELIWRFRLPGPVVMIRRSAFSDPRVGRFREPEPAEDFNFYLQLLAIGALGFIDCKVAAYRLHSTNMVRTVIPAIHRAGLKIAWTRARDFKGVAALGLRLYAAEQFCTENIRDGRYWFRFLRRPIHIVRTIATRMVLARNSARARRVASRNGEHRTTAKETP